MQATQNVMKLLPYLTKAKEKKYHANINRRGNFQDLI